MKTCTLVDFLLLLTVFPPCLSRNNVAWSVAHGRFFWPLPDAWVVAVKRREGEHEWRSHGIVAGYSSALTCQYSVKCCAVTACGPPYVRNPAQHRLEKRSRTIIFFFPPSSFPFDSPLLCRESLPRCFCSAREPMMNWISYDGGGSNRLLPTFFSLLFEQGFRERTGGKDEEEDWTLARAVARLVIIFRVASFEDIPSCVFPRRFKKDGIKFPSGGINSISGERLYYFRRFSILVRHVQSYAIEGENWTCELNRSFKMYFDEFRARITSRDSSLLKILRVAFSSSKTRIPVWFGVGIVRIWRSIRLKIVVRRSPRRNLGAILGSWDEGRIGKYSGGGGENKIEY